MHQQSPLPESPPPPPTPEETRDAGDAASARRRRLLALAAAGGTVLLVGVLWATGGLKATDKAPAAAVGRPVDQGRFEVTVTGARVETLREQFSDKTDRFIVVRLRVTAKDKETATLGDSGLPAGIGARTRTGAYVRPDRTVGRVAGGQVDALQPGLPAEVAVMWRLGGSAAPARFTVALRKWKYGQGFTDRTYYWQVGQDGKEPFAGQVTLPVQAT